MIKPEDLIKRHNVEYFCKKADEYFAAISNPIMQLGKPFSDLREAPGNLYNLGLLIGNLHLGKSMKILDFGAGTCWLSRFLNQLGCITVSVDVSGHAIELGKRLFREYPIIGECLDEPEFYVYNGVTLPLKDEYVDRVICFDALHHVPNREKILKEICRVLKKGGIAGFAEPGWDHSQTAVSQYEMGNYETLENDINLDTIWKEARKTGFTGISVVPLLPYGFTVGIDEYYDIINNNQVSDQIRDRLIDNTRSSSIFFLNKGDLVHDSRVAYGLNHELSIEKTEYEFEVGKPVEIRLTIKNTGQARWLSKNKYKIGMVKVGAHLYDSNLNLRNLDFFRAEFEKDIEPGETITKKIHVTIDERDTCYLTIDLVAENISWFENMENKVVQVKMVPS